MGRRSRAFCEVRFTMCRRLSVLLAAALIPVVTHAQQPTLLSAKEASKEMSKAYVPGLEQFMNVILIEHNKLWFAAKARKLGFDDAEIRQRLQKAGWSEQAIDRGIQKSGK